MWRVKLSSALKQSHARHGALHSRQKDAAEDEQAAGWGRNCPISRRGNHYCI
jgi:hypothetical protein